MADKPRVRVQAGSEPKNWSDSFANAAAMLGLGRDSGTMASQWSYNFNPLTRNHITLEYAYRGSWIVKQVVDAVADDMTRAGITIKDEIEPQDLDKIDHAMRSMKLWNAINAAIKWSRLYGGAIAVMLIDGQKLDTPLRIETIGKDQFKGLLVMDRWMLNPSFNKWITDYGPDLGMPEYYDSVMNFQALPRGRIHHSRVIRFEGVDQPYYQKISEQGWGISVIEPLMDRLVAFDSTTTGAAQLVYKAHLRTIYIEGLRNIIASGGKSLSGLVTQMDFIRKYQTNEGLTLLDSKDKLEIDQYAFSGLADLLLQFGQQLSGATQIPLVRLFGQSPAGLNSTGESDLRMYYDGINAQQESRLRTGLGRLLEILHRSLFGRAPAEGFTFDFNPLWDLSAVEKAEISQRVTAVVIQAKEANLIGHATSLKELRKSSTETGVFTSISDEDIADAEELDAAPPPTMIPGQIPGQMPDPGEGGGNVVPGDPEGGKGGEVVPLPTKPTAPKAGLSTVK